MFARIRAERLERMGQGSAPRRVHPKDNAPQEERDMTIRIAAALVAAVAGSAIAHADVITQWNFNSNPADANTGTGTILPSTGAGSISTVGGTAGSFASGDASGGSSDVATGDDSGWNITTFPALTAGNETAGIQVSASTVGFTDIVISWDQRHSNSASRLIAFLYTVDGGTTWTRLALSAANATAGSTPSGGAPASTPGLFGSNGTLSAFDPAAQTGAGDDWFNGRSVNLTGVTGVANNPNFGFRLVASFGAGTSYVNSGSGSYATTGTWRFDMVTVNGVVPTPGSVALVALGGLIAGRRRR
jgi:hypothetical protein